MSSPAASASRAFHDFFTTHHADLARLAHRLTGEPDAADDLAADALLEVWRHWERVRAADSPQAYARGIVAVLARNRRRHQMREREVMSEVAGAAEQPTLYQWPDTDAVLDLRTALHRLPHGRRACLVLRYGYGLSEHETATLLGVSVGTVKSQTSRGAGQLVGMLNT